MRLRLRLAACLAVFLVGCANVPSPTPSPEPLPPIGAAQRASLIMKVTPQWEPGIAGLSVGVEGRPRPFKLRPPAALMVVEGPRQVDDTPWYRVYVVQRPGLTATRQDFFAWIPGIIEGERTIKLDGVEGCRPSNVAGIAEMSVIGRARCFGTSSITLEGHSSLRRTAVRPTVRPAWLGTEVEATTVTLNQAGADARDPNRDVPWVELRIPPGVVTPPFDFDLRVIGQFNHPDAAVCTRRGARELGLPVLPDEDPADSAVWCRGQFVVSGWQVVNGPEGRPLRPGEVQLHRVEVKGDSWGCAGVGMNELTWHIDHSQPDPIWLETEINVEGIRIVPYFSPGFQAIRNPELVVIGPNGEIVAKDGQKFDPNEPLRGHHVCPGGRTVAIVEAEL